MTVMTYDLARRIERAVAAERVKLAYCERTGELVVSRNTWLVLAERNEHGEYVVRKPEPKVRKGGEKVWAEVARHPSLIAYAYSIGVKG